MLQEGHPIAYASKALTSSQQNYAQLMPYPELTYLPKQSAIYHTKNVICTSPISNAKLVQLQAETQLDPVLKQLKINDGQKENMK